ncbi:MAG: hypothetical protein K9W42_00090 [Candidatus Heimdallarchaeota archaeon]|nr:hypothetical protein [Candidatus Heimdallarchaeota archaeon]
MMKRWEHIFDCLSTKGVFRIIIYLAREENPVNFSQIDKNIPSIGKQAINTATLCLILNGLVEEKREPKHNQRLLYLTPFGRRIGQYLLGLLEIQE